MYGLYASWKHALLELRRTRSLYIVIFIDEVDVTDATAVGGNEFLIAGGSFITGIGCQHALQTHANALDVLHGGPAG